MAKDEAQAARDRFVELRRKLQAKGLSMEDAMRHALVLVDRKTLVDWLVRDLEQAAPEERAAFIQKVLDAEGIDIHDLNYDDDEEP